MANSKTGKPCAGSMQIHLKYEQQDARSWDFLLRYPESVLKEAATHMVEGRALKVNPSAGDYLLSVGLTCTYSRPITKYKKMSAACLQQSCAELARGNYIESIMLSAYCDIYSFAAGVDWAWSLYPLTYMQISTNRMLDAQDYVEQLYELGNG